jgi:multiple antibiotic resistance protein
MLDLTEYTKFLIAILAISNPIGIIPVFLTMTADETVEQRVKIGKIVVIATTLILLITLFFGEFVLNVFGISIDSFRVGGGILILLMAISMLNTSHGTIKQNRNTVEQHDSQSIAVVPLAMPLLAGPGAIGTVIINASKGSGVVHYGLLAISIIVLGVVLWLIFKIMPLIAKNISTVGINISTRIMGLILAAIAIEFIANGLKGLFPVLNQ